MGQTSFSQTGGQTSATKTPHEYFKENRNWTMPNLAQPPLPVNYTQENMQSSNSSNPSFHQNAAFRKPSTAPESAHPPHNSTSTPFMPLGNIVNSGYKMVRIFFVKLTVNSLKTIALLEKYHFKPGCWLSLRVKGTVVLLNFLLWNLDKTKQSEW